MKEDLTKNKTMNNKITIFILGAFVLILFTGTFIALSFVGYKNDEIDLRNRFEQKIDERTAFYDRMWKILAQKSSIALKNDSSFRTNINIVMSGRKDSDQLIMKWVTETNPNANYDQVSGLYRELSRTVESERDGFFQEEKSIQDIVREHKNLCQKFPGSLFLSVEPLVYKPITSDRTDDVIKSGKDNNTKLW